MKKILSVLLVFTMCLLVVGCENSSTDQGSTPVVPEHEHSYSTKWQYDEEYHWHKANCQHTDLTTEKVAHDFEEKVTIEPTEKEEGKKVITCKECGYAKEETLERLPQTSYAYTAYNADGSEIGKSDSIWNAIVQARNKSKSSNKCYVTRNADGVEVYKYSTKNYYCYRGDEYVETKTSESTALTWGKKYANSYVLNGQATEFIYIGKKVESKYGYDKDSVAGTENFSGPYGFLYSKAANNCKNSIGYTFIQFEVSLSEARLKYSTDNINEKCWNAYVFANFCLSNPWVTVDLGIMCLGGEKDGEWTPGSWVPCINYKSTNYSNISMFNPCKKGGSVTDMKYNPETGYYEDGDDLLITAYIWQSGSKSYFVLNIKNLNPNSACENLDEESPLYGTKEWEALFEIPEANIRPSTSKLLLAASNCPVQRSGNFWNPDNGNAFENVVFRNMEVAQWGSHGNRSEYGYDHVDFDYIFTMGADNCTITHGTDSEGQYFVIDMRNYNE